MTDEPKLHTAAALARVANEARGIALREAAEHFPIEYGFKCVCGWQWCFDASGVHNGQDVYKKHILALSPDAIRAADEMVAKAVERYSELLELNRTKVADGVTAIKKAIHSRQWLTEGRGSYAYDDDRWHGEFAAAIEEIETALQPLAQEAADWKDCPKKWDDVIAARTDLRQQLATAQATIKKLREGLSRIAYLPFVRAEATHRQVLDDITTHARDLLAAVLAENKSI